MAKTKITLNHSQMRAMLASGEIRQALHRAVGPMKSAAESSSPVGDPEDGHYRDNFVIEDRTSPKDGRAVVRLTNTSPYASRIEARYRILGRALGSGS